LSRSNRPPQVLFSYMDRPYTILFVEDEVALRELVMHLLSEEGFVVLTAADGHEALRILAERHVDVLFTDIVMPGISGFQLASQAKLMRPNIKVLYVTGHAQTATGGNDPRHGKLLPKPLRPALLVWEINTLLEGAN